MTSVGGSAEAFTGAIEEGFRVKLVAARAAGELSPDKDPDVLAAVLSVFDMGLLSFRALASDRAELLRYIEELERLLD